LSAEKDLEELIVTILDCMKRFLDDAVKRKKCKNNEASKNIIGVKLWQVEEENKKKDVISKLRRLTGKRRTMANMEAFRRVLPATRNELKQRLPKG